MVAQNSQFLFMVSLIYSKWLQTLVQTLGLVVVSQGTSPQDTMPCRTSPQTRGPLKSLRHRAGAGCARLSALSWSCAGERLAANGVRSGQKDQRVGNFGSPDPLGIWRSHQPFHKAPKPIVSASAS